MLLARSLIFVPGNSTRFVEKAKTLAADIICFDLEDSVPINEKDTARRIIADAISHRHDYRRPVYVRVNSPQSGLIADDLKAAVRKGIDGIVIPKVNNPQEMAKIKRQVAALEKKNRADKISMMPSIESANGVVNAYEIASSDDRVNALIFGVFDFLHDMGLDYDEHDSTGYAFARAKIPVDARAAGVQAIDAIWQKIDDTEGLVKDANMAKRLGYSGKSLIHPNQIEPVHNIFQPSSSEVEWAKKVVQALGEAMERGRGRGAVRLEGRMIDAVHYKQAKAILDAANGRTPD
ncbi:MAG TPA: CoA ester lyase [Nitrososphaera sp.]|nr:CoA ester lyase [Nitrososphaera sp.]